ncbi:hypothetical protein [Streptomyces sp. NPDC001594]|uniref:hypothetical protein n=1 Tax=Streptomyces sp. NPDC001594 TaxID=3364590 RepID=UPI00368A32A5
MPYANWVEMRNGGNTFLFPSGVDPQPFLTDCPTTPDDFMTKGEHWHQLFLSWHEKVQPTPEAKKRRSKYWPRTVTHYSAAKTWDETLAQAAGSKPREAYLRYYHQQVRIFLENCHAASPWLRAQEKDVREKLEQKQAAETAWPWNHIGSGVAKEAVAQGLKASVERSAARAWLTGNRRDEPHAVVKRMERELKAWKSKMLPPVHALAEAGATLARHGAPEMTGLGDSASKCMSAESVVRDACAQLVRSNSMDERLVRDAKLPEEALEDLITAWAEYMQACHELVATTLTSTEEIVKWAQAEAKGKIQANFASVCPKTVAALAAIGAMVGILPALIAALGATSLSSGATGTAFTVFGGSVLNMAKDYINEKMTAWISGKIAENPATVITHTGRDYTGEARREWEKWLSKHVKRVAPVAANGTRALGLQRDWPKATIIAPFEQYATALTDGMAVGAEVFYPKTLQRKGAAQQTDEAVGAMEHVYRVRAQGLRDSDPQDVEAALLRSALSGLIRESRPSPAGVPCPEFTLPGGEQAVRFSLLGKDGHRVYSVNDFHMAHYRSRDIVTDKRRRQAQTGFECTTLATTLGLPSEMARDVWSITFTLSPEGIAVFQYAKFQVMQLWVPHDVHISLSTRDENLIPKLREIHELDPERHALQKFPALFDVGATSFSLTEEGIEASSGIVVPTEQIPSFFAENARRTAPATVAPALGADDSDDGWVVIGPTVRHPDDESNDSDWELLGVSAEDATSYDASWEDREDGWDSDDDGRYARARKIAEDNTAIVANMSLGETRACVESDGELILESDSAEWLSAQGPDVNRGTVSRRDGGIDVMGLPDASQQAIWSFRELYSLNDSPTIVEFHTH